jgi:UDP-N-acetylglucosamine:LPS N-acetylglucosamine transferase
MTPRVLIVTADIGAGHDLPAALLADGIRERMPDAEVTVVDGLVEIGPAALRLVRTGTETVLQHLRPLFELQYWLIARLPTHQLAQRLAMLIGGRALVRLVTRTRPDVIVSTYPATTEVFGRLREQGRLEVPLVSAITDLAALRWWAHRGADLHLIIHAESEAEVRRVAGPATAVCHVRGLSRPEFTHPPSREAARTRLGLDPDPPLVLVSGGGWGIGDLERAARVALERPGVTVTCLCGSNAALRERLARTFAAEPRLRAEGFTDDMCAWLSAADVLVHSTAGLTVLEAQMCGTWAISYGWGIGHIRLNNRAYERFGLADVATSPDQLRAALERRLGAPRPRDHSFAMLPVAADEVLALARRR